MIYKSGEYITLVNSLAIRDTKTHSYDTDPPNSTYTNEYIAGRGLSQSLPSLVAYAIWINNTTGQSLTVQPVANVGDRGQNNSTFTYAWFNAGSSYSVAAGAQDWHSFTFSSNPYEYISVNLSFATAPTSGVVDGTLYLYRTRS